jgi:hypothetical protein
MIFHFNTSWLAILATLITIIFYGFLILTPFLLFITGISDYHFNYRAC